MVDSWAEKMIGGQIGVAGPEEANRDETWQTRAGPTSLNQKCCSRKKVPGRGKVRKPLSPI